MCLKKIYPFFVGLFLLMCSSYCGLADQPQKEIAQTASLTSGFFPLPYSAADTFLACSPDGTKLAVLYGGRMESMDFCGKSLEVWLLDSNHKPKELIFQDKRPVNFGARLVWAGDWLLYSALVGLKPDEFGNRLGTNPMSAISHIHGYCWAEGIKKPRDFPPARNAIMIPSASFNHQASRIKIATIDPLTQFAEVMESRLHGSSKTSRNRQRGIPISVYDVPSGQHINTVHVDLHFPDLTQESYFIPLFLSHNGEKLIATAFSDTWVLPHEINDLDFLISIDLKSGVIKSLTSDAEPDKLQPLQRRFNEPRLPSPVQEGNVVACALDAAARNLDYRFQFFNVDTGLLEEELKAGDRDVRRAGIPAEGVTIAFTPAGDPIIQANDNVWQIKVNKAKPEADKTQNAWLYKMGEAHGYLVAKQTRINDVLGWAGPHCLLVRAKRVDESSNTESVGLSNLSKGAQWGFLVLP